MDMIVIEVNIRVKYYEHVAIAFTTGTRTYG